jgi:cell division protease FtsH
MPATVKPAEVKLAQQVIGTFEGPRRALFLDVPSMAQREYSEVTARRIDTEIAQLLEASHGRVRETLKIQRDMLTALAKLLIEKEVVIRSDLDALLKSAKAT